MTAWMFEKTRHIPDDELHAYLDQALSRSQCVEIECHLAECRQCQVGRDRVAAVRDQTTALLSQLLPPRKAVAPPFETLVAKHQLRRKSVWSRVRPRQAALWAASLAGAVITGWWGRTMLEHRAAAPALTPITVAQADLPVARELTAVSPVKPLDSTTALQQPPASLTPSRAPVVTRSTPTPPAGTQEVVPSYPATRYASVDGGQNRATPLAVQVSSVSAEESIPQLEGIWQSVDWDEAKTLLGASLPRIEGLPVLDIQLQRGAPGERPLVVVAQQYPTGEVVHTIEGPVQRVSELIQLQNSRNPNRLHASEPARTPPDYLDDGGTARRGLRVVTVTGSMSADTLNALARNLGMRE
jgi:hypothetical protein